MKAEPPIDGTARSHYDAILALAAALQIQGIEPFDQGWVICRTEQRFELGSCQPAGL